MSATDGAWDASVENAIPTETIVYGTENTQDARDLFVIHAALLRTGRVLWFSGHAEFMHYATVSFVFDPDTLLLHRIEFPTGMDLFCCHFVQLEDGRLLTVGGSHPDFNTHDSRGARNIVLFEPLNAPPFGRWVRTGKQLRQGRWYPTAVLLGDGRVLVFSGRLEPGRSSGTANIAREIEVLSPPDFTSRLLTSEDIELPLYPGLHLAPDGRIYYTHTNWGQQIPEPTDRALRVTGPTSGTWNDFGALPGEPRRREEGMSVLLPPAQDGKILVVGGSEARNSAGVAIMRGGGGPNAMNQIADPADPRRANILNTSAGGAPTWTPAPGGGLTAHGRINGHLVLLPDATVLVCGGHNFYKWNDVAGGTTPSRVAEIFTPTGPAAGFRAVASMTHPRMYHSAALLLPDGSVLVAGGADANSNEPELPWPGGWPAKLRWTLGAYALNRKSREIYRPPYFFKGTRPNIANVTRNGTTTRQIPYGSTFVVTTPQAADITVVALMRLGAATHHTDSEQRYVPLTFARAGNDLTVTMLLQTQNSVAPPGYYMLWIVDNQQRPCNRAVFVQIPGPPRPAPSSSWPCFVATVTMGSEDAAEVVLLRSVREDLETASTAGRGFIRVVNGIYYSFSPQVAAVLARHDLLRLAARDVVVRPGASAIALIVRVAGLFPDSHLRRGALMALLCLLAAAAVALAPLAALGVIAHLGLALMRRRIAGAPEASTSAGDTRNAG
jgi:hypothetical protein